MIQEKVVVRLSFPLVFGGWTDLEVGSGLDAGQLVGQGEHGRAVLQELVQHKVQQGGLTVSALHICQLQQGIQLEACHIHTHTFAASARYPA